MTGRAARQAAEARGRRGEWLAACYLRLKGWRIIARRVKVGGGEVDLVAKRGRTVAFVEVKHRATTAALDHAIDAPRLRRVVQAAARLAPRFVGPNDDMRVDVILIAPGRWPRHLVNVTL